MKKLLLFAATAAILSSACSKSENAEIISASTEGKILAFDQYTGRSTRANDSHTTGTTLPDGASFGVFAYSTGTENWDESDTPNFMFNEKVTFNESENTYTYAPAKYWSSDENDNYTFLAYYPYEEDINNFCYGNTGSLTDVDGAQFSNTSADFPLFSYTVNSDPTKQSDLMVSILRDIDNRGSNMDGKVCFTFFHILSKVTVQAQMATTLDSETQLTVNSVKFDNIKHTGTMDPQLLVKSWKTTDDMTSITATTNSVGDANKFTSADGTTAKDILDDANIMYMMPQTLDDTATITVEYEIKSEDSKLPGGYHTTTHTVTIPINGTTWSANSHIAYTLSISNDSIEFCAHTSSWLDTPTSIDVVQ